MYLTRFELHIDGHYAGCGIFQEIANSTTERAANRYMELFAELPVPPIMAYAGKCATSWFTEKGLSAFREPIRKLKSMYRRKELYDVVQRTEEIPETSDRITYRDDYQVVLIEKRKGAEGHE